MSLRGGDALGQQGQTLHQVDERGCKEGHASGQLSASLLGLLHRETHSNLQYDSQRSFKICGSNPILSQLERKGIYQACLNMLGMTGVTIRNTLHASLTTRKSSLECWQPCPMPILLPTTDLRNSQPN